MGKTGMIWYSKGWNKKNSGEWPPMAIPRTLHKTNKPNLQPQEGDLYCLLVTILNENILSIKQYL